MVTVSKLQKSEPARYVEALRAPAEKGSVNAMSKLAWAYHRGIGTAVDLPAAEKWYRRAQEGGATQVFYYLGTLYRHEEAFARACEIYAAGAAANDQRSIYWLGRMYRDGLGVAQDRRKARELFERASNHGNLFARSALSKLLMSGRCASRV